MLGQHFTTILAQTDPFDLAQGIERYVRSLSGEQIRFVIAAARPVLNEGYRSEFMPLLDEHDDDRLKTSFVQALKSNLRAVPLFGAAFCEGVITRVPGDRAVALGEEGYNVRQVRPLAFGVIALALLIAGAAGEHVWSTARATAQTPVVLVTPDPAISALTPAPAPPAAAKPVAAPQRTVVAAERHAVAVPTDSPPTPAPAAPPPATSTVSAPEPAPAHAAPAHAAPAHAAPARQTPQGTPPPGRGVLTVVAVQHTPEPTPEPTAMDLSDMPQAFTDATPLPKAETAPPAQVPTRISVATPTPGPNRSWTHRLVHAGVNLVDGTLKTIGVSKKPAPSPTASPSGPQPR